MGDVGYQVVFYRFNYDTHSIDIIVAAMEKFKATFCGSFSFPSSNCGYMILPFMVSNTLFLARMMSILVFHALNLEAPYNFFSNFIE